MEGEKRRGGGRIKKKIRDGLKRNKKNIDGISIKQTEWGLDNPVFHKKKIMALKHGLGYQKG